MIVLAVLDAAVCSTEDVLKVSIYIKGDEDVTEGLAGASPHSTRPQWSSQI